MSDSVQPHRRQPTRLPRPWESPGKNTGVGCHFLLQCVKVKSGSEIVQSCQTLRDPMDCSLPGSSVHGIFQARVLECGPIAFSTSSHRLEENIHNTHMTRDFYQDFILKNIKILIIRRQKQALNRHFTKIFYEL